MGGKAFWWFLTVLNIAGAAYMVHTEQYGYAVFSFGAFLMALAELHKD